MNSATSSSESEYEHLYYNSFGTTSYRRTPLYPTLGQPLVYYAEVKPKKRSRRNREDEKKSNCFVKAFRWYTREHVPFKKNQSTNDINNADVNGFAVWLDEKYNEYLQTNQNEQNQYILSQTSTLQVINTCEIFDNKLQASKKFPRIKSPWSKRAKSLISGDKTNFTVKSNQSIKIILKSKNLSYPASACCQRSDFQTHNRSKSSVISDTSALHTKLKPTSKSLTSVLKEKEIYVIPFEILQHSNHKDMKDYEHEIKTNDRKKLKQIFPMKESFSNVKSQYKKDVYCQCSYNTLEKNNTFHKVEKKLSNICHCCEAKPVLEFQQKMAVISETRTDKKFHTSSSSVSAVVSDGVQTSDYSINLGSDIMHNYPLFVKIVCADEVKENDD